jgi:hypothetical protein
MDNRPEDQTLALWLAPFFSTLPLVPLFGLRASPLFFGRLMDDPMHLSNWPAWGPWLSSMAVLFDGIILAYVVALLVVAPLYRLYRGRLLFAFGGVVASQLVHLLQNFRQPDLRAFATSWLSPLVGCLCGLAAGAFFTILSRSRFSRRARTLLYAVPIVVLLSCGLALIEAAKQYHRL